MFFLQSVSPIAVTALDDFGITSVVAFVALMVMVSILSSFGKNDQLNSGFAYEGEEEEDFVFESDRMAREEKARAALEHQMMLKELWDNDLRLYDAEKAEEEELRRQQEEEETKKLKEDMLHQQEMEKQQKVKVAKEKEQNRQLKMEKVKLLKMATFHQREMEKQEKVKKIKRVKKLSLGQGSGRRKNCDGTILFEDLKFNVI